MTRRLIRRNANACFALALGCAPFVLLFLLLAWHEKQLSMLTLLLCFLPVGLIYLGQHFEKTEQPREVWWIGSATDYGSADLSLENAKAFLYEFAAHIENGFGDHEINDCINAMQQA